MQKLRRYRRQRLIAGVHREPAAGLIHPDIDREIDRAAQHFGVSRPWVIAQALADYMGISLEPRDRYNASASKRTAPGRYDIRLVKDRRVG